MENLLVKGQRDEALSLAVSREDWTLAMLIGEWCVDVIVCYLYWIYVFCFVLFCCVSCDLPCLIFSSTNVALDSSQTTVVMLYI